MVNNYITIDDIKIQHTKDNGSVRVSCLVLVYGAFGELDYTSTRENVGRLTSYLNDALSVDAVGLAKSEEI